MLVFLFSKDNNSLYLPLHIKELLNNYSSRAFNILAFIYIYAFERCFMGYVYLYLSLLTCHSSGKRQGCLSSMIRVDGNLSHGRHRNSRESDSGCCHRRMRASGHREWILRTDEGRVHSLTRKTDIYKKRFRNLPSVTVQYIRHFTN